jgi:putative DNA primase/helicase
VLIWPDKDEPGFKCANEIKEHLKQLGMVVKIINPPKHFNDKDDLMDAFERGEQLNILEYAKDNEYDVGKRVVWQNYGNFKDKDYPEMVWMVENLFARGHLGMLFSPPGQGKSLLSQVLSVCLAAGYDFGHYHIPRPQKVLLIDAEMPPVSLQERFADMMMIFDGEVEKEALIKRVQQNLIIVSHHDQPEGLIPLNTDGGKEWFYNLIDDVSPDKIILDNLLTLMQFEDSNSAEEWSKQVNPLLLRMRREDRSVLFLHHSGKSGKQLGSMSKEVILDFSIRQSLEIDEDDEDGILGLDSSIYESKFKWTFEKTRHFYGQHAYPVLWKYSNGVLTKDLTDKEMRIQVAAKMKNEGLSNKDIAKELKVNERTIRRDLKTAESIGFIDDEPEF